MGKVEENKLDKFRRILDSAYALSEHRDVHLVSIDEIVRKAGVSKGTFYLYFKDKFDLISKIIIDRVGSFMTENEAYGGLFESSSDLRENVESLIVGISEFLKKNMPLTRLIDKNVHVCVGAVIGNLSGAPKELYDSIIKALESKGLSVREAEKKLYIFFATTVSSCCNALLRGVPYGIDEVCRELADIFGGYVSGAAAPKGEAEA